MDSVYKDALQKIRLSANQEPAMFQTSWNYLKEITIEVEPETPRQELPTQVASEIETPLEIDESAIDKTRAIKALKDFSQKMLKEVDSGEVNINGASIKATEHVEHTVSTGDSLAQVVQKLTEIFPEQIGEHKRNSIEAYKQDVKVFFITDSIVERAQFEADSAFGAISCYFKPEVSQLFYNMVGALNLNSQDYYISSMMAGNEDCFESLKAEIFCLKPKFIVTLGASASSVLLKSDQRLKSIHGQFFDLQFKSEESFLHTKLMPLFSPKLLHTAPNMKKTAWRDMQKLIAELS